MMAALCLVAGFSSSDCFYGCAVAANEQDGCGTMKLRALVWVFRLVLRAKWFRRQPRFPMPKDHLFPPVFSANRMVRLTGDAPLAANMLGALVALGGHTLTLAAVPGYGFLVVTGPGSLAGAVVASLTGTQAMLVVMEDDGSFHVVDQPDLDLTALLAHAASMSNPHGVTKAQVGLGDVDNTPDSAKPVSTAQAAAIEAAKQRANHAGTQPQASVEGLVAALAAKAPLASPEFSGVPTVPTATTNTQTEQAASTAFVWAVVAAAGGTQSLSWGNIGGQLGDQADLVLALNAKASNAALDAAVAAQTAALQTCPSTASRTFNSSQQATIRSQINAQAGVLYLPHPPLSRGTFARSTLSFSGDIVASGNVVLNGVSIKFRLNLLGPAELYTLIFNTLVTPAEAAEFVARTINQNQEVFGCVAVDNGNGTVQVVARVEGVAGNAITTTDDMNVAAWTGSTLQNGGNSLSPLAGTPGLAGQVALCGVGLDPSVITLAPTYFLGAYKCVRAGTNVQWAKIFPFEIRDVSGLQAALDSKAAVSPAVGHAAILRDMPFSAGTLAVPNSWTTDFPGTNNDLIFYQKGSSVPTIEIRDGGNAQVVEVLVTVTGGVNIKIDLQTDGGSANTSPAQIIAAIAAHPAASALVSVANAPGNNGSSLIGTGFLTAGAISLSGGTPAVPSDVAASSVGQLLRYGPVPPYQWYVAQAVSPTVWGLWPPP
jgi:hypothetical protein